MLPHRADCVTERTPFLRVGPGRRYRARPMGMVLVLPVTTAGQLGPVAAYVSTAGWAAAAHPVTGGAWIITPSGEMSVEEARAAGSAVSLASRSERGWRARVPAVAATLVKDARAAGRSRRFAIDGAGPWPPGSVDLVWQRHELFHHAGVDLAARLEVPSVVFVPATAVWEARRWGVKRPGWGPVVEHLGESRILRRADLVAAGSAEVAEQVQRLGVDPDKILITPTGVDLEPFDRPVDREARRTSLGLDGRFVVGWIGSFRPFHALDRLVDALAGLPGATLLLVGDGPERGRIEDHARAVGVEAHVTGTIAHAELPTYLAAMDAAVVVPPAGTAFHYSPLKLAEYLAAGLPVVVPDLDPVRGRVTDGVDALVVTPGDEAALRAALERIRGDADLAGRLRAGALLARERFTWDEQVRRVTSRLGINRS